MSVSRAARSPTNVGSPHTMSGMQQAWPAIPYDQWKDTCTALHLWSQIVGKYRLTHTPWINHSWHATLYVTSAGLTTGPVPDGDNAITATFDLHDHRLVVQNGSGRREQIALEPMSVAEFYTRFGRLVTDVGGHPRIHGRPNEMPEAIPFAEDRSQRPYDAAAVERFHQALLAHPRTCSRSSAPASWARRVRCICSGEPSISRSLASRDAAVRFTRRGSDLPDSVTREAYSHEVSSAGFWPGGGGADEPMFYSYAYPKPEGFEAAVEPMTRLLPRQLHEHVLPYEAVRTAADRRGPARAPVHVQRGG